MGRAQRVQAFSPKAKTLAQAEFISAEHIKPSGPQFAPGAHWVLGDIAEYPGMKAFFNLK